MTIDSRAGGGGASAGAAMGKAAARAAAATSNRDFFSRDFPLFPPPLLLKLLDDGDGSEPSARGDPIPAPPEGEGRSEMERIFGVSTSESCSPHISVPVPSDTLPFSPGPSSLLVVGEPKDSGLGSSA